MNKAVFKDPLPENPIQRERYVTALFAKYLGEGVCSLLNRFLVI